MSKIIELPYSVLDLENLPNEGRLANIATPQTTKKWRMSQVEDFFIFSIKFWAPSIVYFLDIKGNNTHNIDLIFKDPNQNFLCEYTLNFETLQDNKIIEIREHPLCQYVEVKLLNRVPDRLRMGLGYMVFKGKSEMLKNIKEAPSQANSTINAKVTQDKKSVFSLREGREGKRVEIDLEPESELVEGENAARREALTEKPNEIYEEEEGKNFQREGIQKKTQETVTPGLIIPVKVKANQRHIVIDEDSNHRQEYFESKFPLTLEELESQIFDNSDNEVPYVTYPYDKNGEWWKILEVVNKSWVTGQRNLETEKGIADQHRMSSKIQVKHLFGRKLLAEGLDPQRKSIIESVAKELGGIIILQPQGGCLVVTTREIGLKIKNRKLYKNTVLVTQQYVFNCKRFDAHLNEDDYRI